MFKFLLFLTLSLATTSAFGAALDRRHRQSLRRGTANTCSTQEGAGTCQTASQCDGISYGAQGLCPYDPQDVQCCVKITCSVPEGQGLCRSAANGCEGTFVAGNTAPSPCPGGSDIQCCVPSTTGGGISGRNGGAVPVDARAVGSNRTTARSSDSEDCDDADSDAGPEKAAGIGESVKLADDEPKDDSVLPGLDAIQSKNARAIFAVGKIKKISIKGCEVAIATALVESTIHIYASSVVAGSEDCDDFDEGFIGSDHDSIGVFQQRPTFYSAVSGGDICNLMKISTSAGYFFDKLLAIIGWETKSVGDAAQAVQISEFPDRYADHVDAATKICEAGYNDDK